MPDRAYTEAELDAALAAITEPGRLSEAQDLVMRTAPALQHVLGLALEEGGWFDSAHEQAVREAATAGDDAERISRLRTMLADESRLGMLVGVAVGFELARELGSTAEEPGTEPTEDPGTEPTEDPGTAEDPETEPTEDPGTEPTRQED